MRIGGRFCFANNDPLGAAVVRQAQIKEKIGPSIDLMLETSKRRPTPDEVHMATAYSQSHASACLKRHVGAVIVDPDGLPLSLGYNENPVGMKPCIHEFTYCFKDNDMHAKMESLTDIWCSKCGQSNPKLSDPWLCSGCKKDMKISLFPSRNMELCTAIHAEERAIRSLHGRCAKNATMYVTTFPCFQCAIYNRRWNN